MDFKTALIASAALGLAQLASAAGPGQPLPKPPLAPAGSQLLPAPAWADLTEAERDALSPLRTQFDSLEPQQRRKWRALSERAPSWTPERKQRIQSKMALWASMSPEQRAAARQQALAAREASGSPGRAESWRRWSQLEEQERADLRGRALPGAPAAPASPP